eukprot:1156354-Pelagomonas_calceolata.AAC.4
MQSQQAHTHTHAQHIHTCRRGRPRVSSRRAAAPAISGSVHWSSARSCTGILAAASGQLVHQGPPGDAAGAYMDVALRSQSSKCPAC